MVWLWITVVLFGGRPATPPRAPHLSCPYPPGMIYPFPSTQGGTDAVGHMWLTSIHIYPDGHEQARCVEYWDN